LPHIAGGLFSAGSAFANAAPWRTISERECFQLSVRKHSPLVVDSTGQSTTDSTIRQSGSRNQKGSSLEDETATTGTIWVSVIGESAESESDQGEKQQEVQSKGTFGIAIFFSRLDLEARVAPAEYPVHRPQLDSKTARCSFTNATAEDVGHELKRTKPRKFDVRTGLELQYADAQALRAHWPSVRAFARPLTERDEGIKVCTSWLCLNRFKQTYV
jgi:hypothetical protein